MAMITDYAQTFDEYVSPSSFSWACDGGGVNNLTYNDAAKSMDCPGFNSTCTGPKSLAPGSACSAIIYEADLELLRDGGSNTIGVALVSNIGYGAMRGYRINREGKSWVVYRFSSYMTTGGSTLSIPMLSSPSFTTGERKVIRVEYQYGLFRVFVDGVELCRFVDTTYEYLLPAIYYSNQDVRIHSLLFQVQDIPAHSILTKLQRIFWANSETRQQAWPGENSEKEAHQRVLKSFSVTSVPSLTTPPREAEFGFIQGVVTRKTIPVEGKRVICLDNRFNLVAETKSGLNGYYRFDNLPINCVYAIHAYDNDTYQYAPVGADRRTPEAYS